jgi:geranylgeranyl diphosphate synthase, type I
MIGRRKLDDTRVEPSLWLSATNPDGNKNEREPISRCQIGIRSMNSITQNSIDKPGPEPDHALDMVGPAMAEVIADLHPILAQVCRYHLGWIGIDGQELSDSERREGKRQRAALVFAAARATGGTAEQVLPGAVSIELFHNATLVHDDIIDNDALRRCRPSVWTVFGRDLAILAGDALVSSAASVLAVEKGEWGQFARQSMSESMARVLGGLALELQLETHPTPNVDDYISMARDKAGALLGQALTLGAAAYSAVPIRTEALNQAGFHLGLALQAANDIDDIWGDSAATGKPAQGDLRRGLRTLPVLIALASETASARTLREQWRSGCHNDRELERISQLIEEAGGRQGAEDFSSNELGLAISCLDQAQLLSPGKEELRSLFHCIIDSTAIGIERKFP